MKITPYLMKKIGFGNNEEEETNYDEPGQEDMGIPDLDEPFELPKEVLKDNDIEKADS